MKSGIKRIDSDLARAIQASLEGADAELNKVIEISQGASEELDPRTAHHLCLYHYPRIDDKQPGYFKVKIPGGGNCGFYSISLGIINLLLQNRLALTQLQYSQFISFIKDPSSQARKDIKKCLAFYETGKILMETQQHPG